MVKVLSVIHQNQFNDASIFYSCLLVCSTDMLMGRILSRSHCSHLTWDPAMLAYFVIRYGIDRGDNISLIYHRWKIVMYGCQVNRQHWPGPLTHYPMVASTLAHSELSVGLAVSANCELSVSCWRVMTVFLGEMIQIIVPIGITVLNHIYTLLFIGKKWSDIILNS